MTNDAKGLVERLRTAAVASNPTGLGKLWNLCDEAADLIEKLTAPLGDVAGELGAIEARANAATPGPWTVYAKRPTFKDTVFYKDKTVCAPMSDGTLMAVANCNFMTPAYAENNAAFIAAAKQDIPRLLTIARTALAQGAGEREKATDGDKLIDQGLEKAAKITETLPPNSVVDIWRSNAIATAIRAAKTKKEA
ncbi:MAG: hypothetical protein KGL39_04725 [Patescibacteria group bacterium]|nr:hypothetical protein [Patescibacteria group bacterium]